MNEIDFMAHLNALAAKAADNGYCYMVTFSAEEMAITIKRKPVIA